VSMEDVWTVRYDRAHRLLSYYWFGELILECSEEFVAADNGTLLFALLLEQEVAAQWGGVASPHTVLHSPSKLLSASWLF
jgi:hypothetical protein